MAMNNCSTIGCSLLNAGGVGSQPEIQGLDIPQNLIDQLVGPNIGEPFNGYTNFQLDQNGDPYVEILPSNVPYPVNP